MPPDYPVVAQFDFPAEVDHPNKLYRNLCFDPDSRLLHFHPDGDAQHFTLDLSPAFDAVPNG
jgi:hypothetical protein